MAGFRSLAALAAAGIMVSGCAATTPPVDVTRFHNAQVVPIVPGTVEINASIADPAANRELEYGTYSAAILRELQRLGFTDPLGDAESSEYVVRYTIDRAVLTAAGSRSPVSVGVGGSTGSYGSGLGLGIGINLGGRPKDKIVTELSVRISRRDNASVVWEGRASVEAKQGSPAAQPGLAASKLAAALFKDFPGVSGTTIRVP
ncbi:MAG: hypothetical protein COA41_00905 [Sphingopyxis sp.]|nr:MAG: hypothetical protein COA41_00905 [Sphingopyxis sp.]